MSTTNVYFTHGTRNEQMLKEDLIIEAIRIWGQEFRYIPRTLVSKDNILGEDRLSKFEGSFPIEMYLETIDGFEGQGAFIQKFGLMMEQSATLTVARRRWEQLVGRYGQTIVPTRPNEGDLIYFPLTGGLFEIKFVKHQDPFYQLNDLASYKLEVELFQYSSEFIDTGDKEIDEFESLKTLNTNTTRSKYGEVTKITMTNTGSNYATAPTVVFTSATGIGATATAVLGGDGGDEVVSVTITNGGQGYQTPPVLSFTSTNPTATATATISAGEVSAVSVTNAGGGYTSAPSVTFSAPTDPPETAIGPTYGSGYDFVLCDSGGAVTGSLGSGYSTGTYDLVGGTGQNGTLSMTSTGAVVGLTSNLTIVNSGSGYSINDVLQIDGGNGNAYIKVIGLTTVSAVTATGTAVLGTGDNATKVASVTITNAGSGYSSTPTVTFTAPAGGVDAAATATINVDVDKIEDYADNNEFGDEAGDVLFDVTNPFGEIE